MIELNKIYNEDCLEGMKRIEDKSIDCIICDLPYGTTACKWDVVIPFDELWEQYNRIIKKDHPIILFSSQPFTTILIGSNIKKYKYSWYWQKNQATNFLHAKHQPLRKIEEICVFNAGPECYNPQKTYGHVPTRAAKGCSNGNVYYGTNKRDYKGGDTSRFPTNLIEFKCVDNYHKIHPSQKPLELIEYLIKTYSNEGDLILDNCMGSGTTAVACLNTNRRFIGFELDKNYFDIATNRINELTNE